MMKSNESVLDKELADATSLYVCIRIRLRLVEAICVDSDWRDCGGCGGKAASTSLTSLAVVCCRGFLLSRCFFAELLLRAHIHTQDYPVVCLVLKSSNAHNGILSARRDVLARGASPLLSRRRGDGVREWDESCSSEQDCGSRAHKVRHQCDT